MTERICSLYLRMVEFDAGEPALIQHFTKVHAYSKLIAEQEKMDAHSLEILEAAALVHDIAIPLCLQKYGSDAGPLQEAEGPALVREMLPSLGFTDQETERVAWLVAHHHTTQNIVDADHQILIEADFLVNAHESAHTLDAKQTTLAKIFKTDTGTRLFRTMFAL